AAPGSDIGAKATSSAAPASDLQTRKGSFQNDQSSKAWKAARSASAGRDFRRRSDDDRRRGARAIRAQDTKAAAGFSSGSDSVARLVFRHRVFDKGIRQR